MSVPFLVLGLPRSRTVWLSRFLSFQPYACYHDQASYVRSVEDVRAWLSQPYIGTVETAAAPFWRLGRFIRPDLRMAVVRRDPADVIESLMRFNCFERERLTRVIARYDRALDRAETAKGCLSVRFEDLNRRQTCERLFEHCLGIPAPAGWWNRIAPQNLQRDLRVQIIYAHAHARLMDAAARECARAVRHYCLPTQASVPPGVDGVVIQQERFADFWRDAKPLMSEHCIAVGEPADEYEHKNLELFERLDRGGKLLIMTARLNGRMLGYLVTAIGPSFEHDDGRQMATQLPFHVGQDASGLGLGMRLQRATIARAKEKGVQKMYARAGIRGNGDRMGVLYRRLGATDFGQLYEIDLTEAA
jgi:GNAT superfamily N-acetyltransferase